MIRKRSKFKIFYVTPGMERSSLDLPRAVISFVLFIYLFIYLFLVWVKDMRTWGESKISMYNPRG